MSSKNGDLLRAAEQGGFDVLVTADQNLSCQQNLTGRALALVVLSTNDWSFIRQVPELVTQVVSSALPGSCREVSSNQLPRRASVVQQP